MNNLINVLLVIIFTSFSFLSVSFAQITRDQADEIIFQYIIDEEMRTDVLLLYTTDILPNENGISTIITHTSGTYETFSIESPCWVYHVFEWKDVNCCRPHRYLFVNKITGNVLEVKTKGSPYYPGPESWQLIYSAVSRSSYYESGILYFSNPVVDFLEINCSKDFEYIVIFDLLGKQVFQESLIKSIQNIDVSYLHKGFYTVNLYNANSKIVSFKILKK